jgi:type IV pilus assembly protein PilY1
MNAATPLRRIARTVAAALMFAAAPVAVGEDIDLFAGLPVDQELPNVLIIWDDSANWTSDINVGNCTFNDGGMPKPNAPDKEQGKKMAIEKCAIYNVIDSLPTGPNGEARFNVGLMLFNEAGGNSGGYPRKQFLPMTAAGKTALKNAIRNITIGGDKGSNAAFTKALHEAYLMFSKAAPYMGTRELKWDTDAVVNGRYAGAPGNGCGRNHIIFVANGKPGEVTNNEARDLLAGAGGDVTPLLYPSSLITNSDQGNWADEYTRFLRGKDVVGTKEGVQSITTHAIAVTGASSDGLYPNFIRAMATQGGGQYYSASNVTDLAKFLTNIFNSIMAVNTAFASASLPISVSAQGTYKNQVFVGVFRPDGNARPRWDGNLKQYKMNYDRATDSLQLVDALGQAALSSSTGFFRPTAMSYWTTDSTFWSNDPKGTPPSASDAPDGEVVEKGAIAQKLRTKYATDQSQRLVYTCIDCSSGTTLWSSSAQRFETANSLVTSGKLGVTSDADRTALIEWIRGRDNQGDERGPGGTTTIRPSVHGDVLHSRPAVVDFGGMTGTVVFYGSNDGFLHAVDGNQSGATAGEELWTFLPEEFLGRFKRFRDNTPEVRYPTTPSGAAALPRDYFVDGPVTTWQRLDENGTVSEVTIYVTMRRGGRFLYAIDVSNPRQPRVLWRKSSSNIAVLGQTWSEPRVVRVRGRSDPVLIMGAGYDAAAEDALPAGATSMGNAVLVLDARTGELVRQLSTARSVVGSIALLDTDFDGYIDRGYAADTGGNVYRLDFETAAGSADASAWTIATFATLGGGTSQRKFFYSPDVVHTRTFTAVMLGSGNRERPLALTTNDRFYTLFDYRVGKGAGVSGAITDANLLPNSDSYVLNASVAGCYLPMDPRGEKVVTSAVTTGGYTYFSTHRPNTVAPDSCTNDLGVAKGYRMALFCGTAESVEFAGGGLPPSPVIGEVEVQVPPVSPPGEPETRRVPFIIGGFNAELSGLAVSRVPIKVDPTRRRTYWINRTTR